MLARLIHKSARACIVMLAVAFIVLPPILGLVLIFYGQFVPAMAMAAVAVVAVLEVFEARPEEP